MIIVYLLAISPAVYFLIHWFRTNETFRELVTIIGYIAFGIFTFFLALWGVLNILVLMGIYKP